MDGVAFLLFRGKNSLQVKWKETLFVGYTPESEEERDET